MSDLIRFSYGKDIRAWMKNNPSPECEVRALTLSEMARKQAKDLGECDSIDTITNDHHYFGVHHTIFTEKGDPIVTLGQVYSCSNAEEALKKYLYGFPVHQSGTGKDCISFKLRLNYWYEMQDIEVFMLAEGTQAFF